MRLVRVVRLLGDRHEVRHFWSCENCGHEIEMRVNPRINAASLACRINARRSAAIFGRPPGEPDFQRQYRRKPARCQRTLRGWFLQTGRSP